MLSRGLVRNKNNTFLVLPQEICIVFSQGCHKLIKQGAILVESIQDILEHLSPYSHCAMPALPRTENAFSQQATDTSTINTVRITPEHPELYAQIGYMPVSIDVLAQQVNLPVDTLLVQLLTFELQDLIVAENGLYQRK